MKSPASKRPTPPKKETRIGKLNFVIGEPRGRRFHASGQIAASPQSRSTHVSTQLRKRLRNPCEHLDGIRSRSLTRQPFRFLSGQVCSRQ